MANSTIRGIWATVILATLSLAALPDDSVNSIIGEGALLSSDRQVWDLEHGLKPPPSQVPSTQQIAEHMTANAATEGAPVSAAHLEQAIDKALKSRVLHKVDKLKIVTKALTPIPDGNKVAQRAISSDTSQGREATLQNSPAASAAADRAISGFARATASQQADEKKVEQGAAAQAARLAAPLKPPCQSVKKLLARLEVHQKEHHKAVEKLRKEHRHKLKIKQGIEEKRAKEVRSKLHAKPEAQTKELRRKALVSTEHATKEQASKEVVNKHEVRGKESWHKKTEKIRRQLEKAQKRDQEKPFVTIPAVKHLDDCPEGQQLQSRRVVRRALNACGEWYHVHGPGSRLDAYVVKQGSSIRFVPNEISLTPGGKRALRKIAAVLHKHPSLGILITGETPVAGGQGEILSDGRASTAKHFLQNQEGVSNLINAVGKNSVYGKIDIVIKFIHTVDRPVGCSSDTRYTKHVEIQQECV